MACLFCGQEEMVEISEVWSTGEFLLDTCCEEMLAEISRYIAEDGIESAKWMRAKGLDALCGLKSRRIIDDDAGQLVVDWNLKIVPIRFRDAAQFVAKHHRHCPPPAGWRFGAGVLNGRQLIGVVMVGRPVARMIDAKTTVEVNRLCVRSDVAQGLVWNACSLLYAWSAREALKRGFKRVITYTLAEESGTSLKAAGWVVEHTSKPGSWSRSSRSRQDKSPTSAKNRWVPAKMAAIKQNSI
jgi:hypothetical protein